MCFQHVLLLLKAVLAYLIPDKPRWVVTALDRVEYQSKQAWRKQVRWNVFLGKLCKRRHLIHDLSCRPNRETTSSWPMNLSLATCLASFQELHPRSLYNVFIVSSHTQCKTETFQHRWSPSDLNTKQTRFYIHGHTKYIQNRNIPMYMNIHNEYIIETF